MFLAGKISQLDFIYWVENN